MENLEFKLCTIWGDMMADRAADQYPQEPLCTDCIAAEEADGENSRIVSVGEALTDSDTVCYFCGCSADD